MTAHDGRGQGGDLPYEGVVLPANGESYLPEQQREAERGGAPQPATGQPWGQPWGPEVSSPPAGGPPSAPPPSPPLPPPPAAPPGPPPGAPPAEGQDRLPQPYGTSGAAPLPPATAGGEQWAPPPPPSPPQTPPAPAAHEVPMAPPVPYEPPSPSPQPPGPYGDGPAHGHTYGHGYGDADATQMLPPQSPSPPREGAGPLPPVADADATQMLPPQQPGGLPGAAPEIGDPWPSPQPGPADAEGTQMLPPQQDTAEAGDGAGAWWSPQPGPGDAEATQMLPPQPGPGDADATQMLPPQTGLDGALPPEMSRGGPAAPPMDAGPPPGSAPYGIRPGAPGDRQPPSEFDSLFRSDAPAPQRGPAAPAGGAGRVGGPDTAPGAAPYGRAARRNADREQNKRGGMSPAVLAGIGVVAVLALGLGVGALISGDEENEPKTSPTAPVAGGLPSNPAEPADTAEGQAKQLDKLLEQSNNSRTSVIRAVQNIKACQKLDSAASDLRAAAKQRNGLVNRLSQIETGELPNSTELNSALTEAWKASAEADNAYAAWADQVAGKKGCKKGEARATRKTAAGNRASGEATTAKKKAAELWNPTAREYGLPERQYTQL